MNKSLKRLLRRIIAAAIIYILALLLPISFSLQLSLFITSYLIVGYSILLKAYRNILRGQVFDENFLMALATLGAFAISEYSEAIAVMLFYQVGEFFQSYAVNKSRKSIAALMDIRPDYANVIRNSETLTVSPGEVAVGETILIKPGERIPLDATVLSGFSSIDTSALTGESLPRDVAPGDAVISGCINLNGVLTAKVNSLMADSTVSKILELVENASSKKAEVENFITKFARYYTPVVVIIAAFLAFVPPLLFSDTSFSDWVYRAITFLVISCPCALVISIPLSFFGGLGAASKCGILIKGSCYLEALAQTGIIVFDKTGTLTKGNFKVTELKPHSLSPQRLLELAAYAEAYSHHPIAQSIQKAYGQPLQLEKIENIKEIQGKGIKAQIEGQTIYAGNQKLMQELGLNIDKGIPAGTIVHITVAKEYAGYILIADEIKEDAINAIPLLKSHGISQTIMLTGDHRSIAEETAQKLGLDQVYSELLPADKVEKIEQLLTSLEYGKKLAFVGDGINDAPVLARADIGIAMGGIGSDAAIEAADIVIMTDEPSKIATAIRIAKGTLKIARQNIIFAIGVKLLVLGLGALGEVSIWAAVFADVGVSVIAILNAIRALYLCPARH